jgi:hypothetical protein
MIKIYMSRPQKEERGISKNPVGRGQLPKEIEK